MKADGKPDWNGLKSTPGDAIRADHGLRVILRKLWLFTCEVAARSVVDGVDSIGALR